MEEITAEELFKRSKRLRRGMDWAHARDSDEMHLTRPQAHILFFLMRQGGELTVSDLQKMLHTPMSNITNICNRLAEAGYVVKRRKQDDQRKVYIALTNKSEALKERFKEKHEQHYRMMDEILTQEEKRVLMKAFDILDNLFKQMDERQQAEADDTSIGDENKL